jgi:hypothetical protein
MSSRELYNDDVISNAKFTLAHCNNSRFLTTVRSGQAQYNKRQSERSRERGKTGRPSLLEGSQASPARQKQWLETGAVAFQFFGINGELHNLGA